METIFFIIGLFVNAALDGLMWRYGRYINGIGHLARFLVRGIFFSILAIYAADIPAASTYESAALLPLMAIMAAAWWMAFDPLVNVIAGQNPFHLGKTSAFDSIFWRLADGEYIFAIMSQYTTKLLALAFCIFWNLPSVFDAYMDMARRFYFQSIW